MRQDLSVDTLGLLAGGKYDAHWKLVVANGSGTLIDLSDRLEAVSGTLPSPDAPIGTAAIEFVREPNDDFGISLAPLVGASELNRLDDGVTYSPQLQLGRDFRLSLALTARGGARPGSGFNEIIRGKLRWVGSPDEYGNVRIACNDQSGALQKTKSEAAYVYAAGTSIEATMQAVLDNNGWSSITLYTPSATSAVLSEDYAPGKQKTVWEQLWALAQSIGWLVWWRYKADGTPALTLFEPDRAKTVVDFTFPVVRAITQLDFDEDDVGNVIYGELSNAAGVREGVGPIEDATSIAKYGGIRRSFWISEPADSPIRTSVAMTAMITEAVLPDLKDPDAIQAATLPLFPFGEVSVDLYGFSANERLYDSDQKYAPFSISYSHRIGGDHETTMQTRGKATAGAKNWRGRSGSVGQKDTLHQIYNLRILEEDATTITLTWDVGAAVDEEWGAYDTFAAPVAGDPWDTVDAALAPLVGGTHTLVLPRPAQGEVVWFQVEARYIDPATGELLLGNRIRREITPDNRQPPVIELDDAETATTGTQWWKVQERGIAITAVEALSQVGPTDPTAYGAPTRGPGDTSVVRGGTLGAGEYEHDVALDPARFSWIVVRLSLETGEPMTLGPFGFDRNKNPNLIDVTVTGSSVKALADSDTQSVKAEKISGGGSAWTGDHVDGQNYTWSVPVGSGETWVVRVTAYSEGVADVDGATPLDFRDVTVLGAGVTPPGEPGGEPGWVTVSATAPSVSSDVVSIVADASSAPGGYTAKLYYRDPDVDPDFTEVDNADLSPDMTLTTSSTPFLWSSGATRAAGAGPTQRWEIKAEILDGSLVPVASETRTVSYRYSL